MDPAVLNYLQQQQSNSMGQNPMQGGNPMQGAMPQQAAPYNPFDSGISKAISSARESLGMTAKQQETAFNNSLLTFGENFAQQPRQKGFWNNLGSVGRALSPAIRRYSNEEEAAITQNNALANQMLAYQAAEEKKQVDAEQQVWERQHKEAQLGEQRRQHDLMSAHQRELLDYKLKTDKKSAYANRQNTYLDKIAPSIRTDSAFDRAGKKAEASAAFLIEVEAIRDKRDELIKAMEEAAIDTSNPLAFKTAIRDASGLFSSFSQDPKLRNVAKLYSDLRSTNKRAMQTAETALTGKALTDFTIKYGDDQKLFPDIGKDPHDIFANKLNTMLHDAQSGYDASDLSMRLGRHVNKKNYPDIKRMMMEQEQANNLPSPQSESPGEADLNGTISNDYYGFSEHE